MAGHIDNDTRPLLKPFRTLPGVSFPGYVDAAAAFREADVFALPSLYEESAKAALEAMACGLPAVVTAETGAPVRDGVEGLLVPPCDAESLAAALERLRTDEHLRREMGRAARARVEEGFTWDGYGDRLVDALQGIAGAA